MKLGFEESQAAYDSGSQSARTWTERWVRDWLYCPNCGASNVRQFAANSPVADFFCGACAEEYELKSQKKAFGAKGARWRVQIDVRATGIEQQPKPPASELRLGAIRCHQCRLGSETVLCSRDHRGAKAVGTDGSPSGLGRLQYSAETDSYVRKDISYSRWRRTAQGICPSAMASDPVPSRGRAGGERVADRGHELRRGDRTKGVRTSTMCTPSRTA